MKTYMDREVFIDFYKCRPAEDAVEDLQSNWQSLKKFLRTQTDLHLNVNLEKEGAEPTSVFMTLLASFGYAGTRIIFNQNVFRFKNKAGFQKEFSNADNLFFINETKEGELERWKLYNGFYIACSKELMETWRKLKLTYGLPKTLPVRDFDVPYNLKSWRGLAAYSHPITDMIISDRYILKSKDLAEANLGPLITSLVANKSAHFNLTVFTSKKEVFEKDVNAMKSYLDKLLERTGLKCTVTLVYDTIERFKEHDRHIITNYFHINSGDSFTLFTRDGQLKTKGTTLDIKPLVDQDYFLAACAVLQNLKMSFNDPNIEKTRDDGNRLFSLVAE